MQVGRLMTFAVGLGGAHVLEDHAMIVHDPFPTPQLAVAPDAKPRPSKVNRIKIRE